MSISRNELGDRDVDYSDFAYQHFAFAHTEAGGNSARSVATGSFEPLVTRGGLDASEVAELVLLYYYVDMGIDSPGNVTDNNTASGSAQFRGVLGANLGSIAEQIETPGDNEVDTDNDLNGTILESVDNSDGRLTAHSESDAGIFAHWQVTHEQGFTDAANGLGGGGHGVQNDATVLPFRQWMGAGPVVDAADDIGIVSTLNKNRSAFDEEAVVRGTMVWDVAQVDNARSQFGIPR